MHVLVVHNRYASAQPSGENKVVDQEVALLRAAGHQVEMFERRSDDIAARSLLGKVRVPLLVPWNPAVRTELAARLRTSRPDVVHVHNVFPLLSPAVLAACADAGVPAVATLHNYTQVCPPGTLQRDGRPCTECVGTAPLPAVRHGCYRGSRLATVPLAVSLSANRRRWWSGVERFFCISAAQRDVLVGAGMPAERLAVKHNFVPEPDVRRSGPGEQLLYLGRLAEAKGVRLLMAAWDEIAAEGGVGVPLVIAGTGPLEGEVTAWAAGRDDVRYAGLYDPAQCRQAIARSVAVVAPSTWLEAFGLVVAEAMAAGVPAVAAGHGAFVELVEDGVTGLLHQPNEAASLASCLRRITDGPGRNEEMGQAARRRYEQGFSPAVGLERLVEGYRTAIAGRSADGHVPPPAGNGNANTGSRRGHPRGQGWGQ
ncbi:glycosyltransferase [Streptomyces iconiensis]|uniref:Glycosyltransferase n=1 Tax=Streptomyces iconiensis TaxID=1384038 RepID=A0ABT6ZQY0_9ACTN|nr:glycosyltransferase [Streptomyces iconiensis]MDJ1131464.1 glycosyltransferase [Streptomyces iconiensis]